MIITLPIKEDFRIYYDGESYMPQIGNIMEESKYPELIGTLRWRTLGYYSKVSSAVKKIIPLVVLERHQEITLEKWLGEYKSVTDSLKFLTEE